MPIKEGNKTMEMAVPLLTGAGKGPPNNPRRVRRPVETPEAASAPLPKEETKEEETKEKTPTYVERLAAAKISVTHAREVMDAVLFNGTYEETTPLRPNFPVVIQTRAYGDTLRLMRVMEAENPTFPMHINDIIARYNVCASLVQYGETVFSPPKEKTPIALADNFEERLQFLYGLPEIVINKLIDLVARFDKKVAIIFSEGSIQDF